MVIKTAYGICGNVFVGKGVGEIIETTVGEAVGTVVFVGTGVEVSVIGLAVIVALAGSVIFRSGTMLFMKYTIS